MRLAVRQPKQNTIHHGPAMVIPMQRHQFGDVEKWFRHREPARGTSRNIVAEQRSGVSAPDDVACRYVSGKKVPSLLPPPGKRSVKLDANHNSPITVAPNRLICFGTLTGSVRLSIAFGAASRS